MKPSTGNHTLTTAAQPGVPSTTVTYFFDDQGCHTTFGLMLWYENPSPGAYMLPDSDIALRFTDEHNFVAVHGPVSYAGTWS